VVRACRLLDRLIERATARPERAILFTIEAWDINRSQHTTERFTGGGCGGGGKLRIVALEAENAAERAARRRSPDSDRRG
jgi:hypothetical protein